MEVVKNAYLGEPKDLYSLHVWSVVQVNGGVRSRGDEDGSVGRNRMKKLAKRRIIGRVFGIRRCSGASSHPSSMRRNFRPLSMCWTTFFTISLFALSAQIP